MHTNVEREHKENKCRGLKRFNERHKEDLE